MYEYMNELKRIIHADVERPLNQTVYEGLRKAIISGIIPVGERLNEKLYSQHLSISRTPIRNAIKRLMHEGVVEHIPGYGVVIKMVTEKDVEEVYKIRAVLEVLATLMAMENMQEQDFLKMESVLAQAEKMNEKGEVREVIKLFSEFNSLILQYAKMPRLELIIGNLQGYLARFRDISLLNNERRACAIAEHRIIFEGLISKDKELIREIVEKHLASSCAFVVKEVNRLL